MRECPVSLMVRILGFHCQGLGSVPGQGTDILQAMWNGQKKKKLDETSPSTHSQGDNSFNEKSRQGSEPLRSSTQETRSVY